MNKFPTNLLYVYGVVSFWVFLAVKIGGTSLAAWSWWWVLVPAVPVTARLLAVGGLL